MRDMDEQDSVSDSPGVRLKGDGLSHNLAPGLPDGVGLNWTIEFQTFEGLFQYGTKGEGLVHRHLIKKPELRISKCKNVPIFI